jgi:c-di-GMP-binding flagellar brake protein YcgR
MEEKRRNARWQINNSSSLDLDGRPGAIDCIIRDISLRGMRVSLADRLSTEEPLRGNVNLSHKVRLNGLEAKVVWSERTGEGNNYGLYFEKIKDADKTKIYDFVARNYPEEIHRNFWG